MATQRRKFSPEFKARVVLELLTGIKGLMQISREYGIRDTVVSRWKQEFLEGLVKRGLHGVQLVIRDDHAGLEAARKAVFTGMPWQRCQFYLQQNAQSYVPKVGIRREVAEDIRTIYNAPDCELAEAFLKKAI